MTATSSIVRIKVRAALPYPSHRLNARRLLIAALVLVGAQLLLPAQQARAASFPCAAAKSFAEHAICDNTDLSLGDDTVTALYKTAREQQDPGAALLEQRDWLARRNKCQAVACLRTAYDERAAELRRDTAAAAQLKRDADHIKVFVEDTDHQPHYEMTLAHFLKAYPNGDPYYSPPFIKCVNTACTKLTIVFTQSSPADPHTDYIHALRPNQDLIIREILSPEADDGAHALIVGDDLVKYFEDPLNIDQENPVPVKRPAVADRVPRNMYVYNSKHQLTLVTGAIALAQTYVDAGYTFKSSCKDTACTQYLYHFKKGDMDDFYIVKPLNDANDVLCLDIVAEVAGDFKHGDQVAIFNATIQAIKRH
jgi:uncharacterized protein YecT (DUF1311 family)